MTDSIDWYLGVACDHPLLTAEQEVSLAIRIAAGDAAARHDLITHNMKLVVSIARSYQHQGLELLDLIQEGSLGLMRAIEKFDYTKGLRFSTYATWWIKQACGRAIDDCGRTVRLPVHMGERISKVARARQRLAQINGVEPSAEEIAAQLGWTAQRVAEVMDAQRLSNPVSADAEVVDALSSGDEPASLIDFLPCHEAGYGEVVASDTAQRVRALLGLLDDRQRRIIELRYGLADGEARTLEQVGAVLGITRERVRQIEAQAMVRLRAEGTRAGLAPDDDEGGDAPVSAFWAAGAVLSPAWAEKAA